MGEDGCGCEGLWHQDAYLCGGGGRSDTPGNHLGNCFHCCTALQFGSTGLRRLADRGREFVSAPLRRWALDRQMIQTLTSRSTCQENRRVEAEVGPILIKRAIKTTLAATKTEEKYWPLVARHVGRRRLLQQLERVGKLQRYWHSVLQCLHGESHGRRCMRIAGLLGWHHSQWAFCKVLL